MNKAQDELQKALKYLDFGRLEKGEQCLTQAIEAADSAGDSTTYLRAAVCYGDLLWQTEKYEAAQSWLQLALDRYVSLHLDTDVLDMEVSRAQNLLEQMAE
ncbi:hypothetical protein [Paenibacillus tyrfis]|uniref:Tetratricopeptide repeat protein n=1 Tax=Paenibacillus tyrfis TaxID=1501230 RepID=A0A081P760_9BACL|nr:hypothetical protein [Paenibacillus tyrfis]KEQ26533.1 hypothetical protein ET33_32310 [Paenibacillus tyrfis]